MKLCCHPSGTNNLKWFEWPARFASGRGITAPSAQNQLSCISTVGLEPAEFSGRALVLNPSSFATVPRMVTKWEFVNHDAGTMIVGCTDV